MEVFTEKVVGVSYNNEDGSSRQKYIKQLENAEPLELELYEYNGEPAVRVNNMFGQCIGHLRKDFAPEIHKYYHMGYTIEADVSDILGKDEFGEWIEDYYAGVEVFIMITSPEEEAELREKRRQAAQTQPYQYGTSQYNSAAKKELTRNDRYLRAFLWFACSCTALFPVSVYQLYKSMKSPKENPYTQQLSYEWSKIDCYIAAALWLVFSLGFAFPVSIYYIWKSFQITDDPQIEELKNKSINLKNNALNFLEKFKNKLNDFLKSLKK